jgi:hypothetical protein
MTKTAGKMELFQWTVYVRPKDYPDKFVARRWVIAGGESCVFWPTTEVIVAETLDQVRAALPRGLYCLPRFLNDDPAILEVWL